MLEKEIRAAYDEQTITVYQAYREDIGLPAVAHQRFVPPFKLDRMTWIKPSFLWMMYRADWGQKEGQEHILAIRIKREGFEWALAHACLSHFNGKLYGTTENWKDKLGAASVRVQWDPEKDMLSRNLSYRSIQIGLSGEAVVRYVHDWIVSIEDITENCSKIRGLLDEGKTEAALLRLPAEQLYPVDDVLKRIIDHS